MTFRAREHPFFEASTPRLFAHRGFHEAFPENTAGAFGAAVNLGARYIETDVVGSKDGIAMIAHDLSLERVAKDSRALADVTAAELAEIDLGGEGFITLRQALELFPATRFNVDIKDFRAIPDAIRVIRDLDAASRVLVTSFSASRRRAITRGVPGSASSASGSEFLRIFAATRLGITPPLPRIQALQIPTRVAGLDAVTPTLIARYHRAGLEVHVWTVNDPAEMTRLMDLGVDGIVTDRIDLVPYKS